MTTGGVEVGLILWKVMSAGFGVLTLLLGYLIKKRDDKIDENTKLVSDLKDRVIIMETKFDNMYHDMAETKENIKGLIECVQDIRVAVLAPEYKEMRGKHGRS